MAMNKNKKIRVHGHRGARGLFPENSLPAIQAAIDCGCDAIEVDICVSRDNRLIIHHDPIMSRDLVRGPKGNWIDKEIRLRELTAEQIKSYDIGRIRPGSDYARQFSSQQSLDGTPIPLLDEFIELVCERDDSIVFNLELKSLPQDPRSFPDTERYIDLVLDTVRQYGIVQRTFVQSFDWRLAHRAKVVMPELNVGFLTDLQPNGNPLSPISGKPTAWTNYQDLADFGGSIPTMIRSLRGDVWSSNYRDITRQDIAYANKLGMRVYVWTVNELFDMQRMIDWGVDAITSDYPNRLIELLNRD